MNTAKPASAIFDNGRRGEPLNFCDCMTCFGYCLPEAMLTDPDFWPPHDIPDAPNTGEKRAIPTTD